MSLTSKLKQVSKKALPFLLAGTLLNPIQAQDKNDLLYHGLEAYHIGINLADYFTTYMAIETGSFIEGAPIIRNFIDNKELFILYKIGLVSLFLYENRQIKKDYPKTAYAALIGLNLLGTYISYRNYKNFQIGLSLNLGKK